jgi:hypothetical protein
MGADLRDQQRHGSRCGKVGQSDRLTAEAVRIGLDIWNKATGADRKGVRVVIFRCKKCGKLHVGRQCQRLDPGRLKNRPQATELYRQMKAETRVKGPDSFGKNHDLRYLIEEFDLG